MVVPTGVKWLKSMKMIISWDILGTGVPGGPVKQMKSLVYAQDDIRALQIRLTLYSGIQGFLLYMPDYIL